LFTDRTHKLKDRSVNTMFLSDDNKQQVSINNAKLTDALAVECVEPSSWTSSVCTRNDVVTVQRTGVTSRRATCSSNR